MRDLPQHLIDKMRVAYEKQLYRKPGDWDRKDEWWGYTRDHFLAGADLLWRVLMEDRDE